LVLGGSLAFLSASDAFCENDNTRLLLITRSGPIKLDEWQEGMALWDTWCRAKAASRSLSGRTRVLPSSIRSGRMEKTNSIFFWKPTHDGPQPHEDED
jgi:hypothetical protein